MRKIKVISGVLFVSAGAVVVLSEGQARPRMHNLAPVTNGEEAVADHWRAKVPLQFKAGEELAVNEVAKGQLEQVEFLDKDEQPELPKATATRRR